MALLKGPCSLRYRMARRCHHSPPLRRRAPGEALLSSLAGECSIRGQDSLRSEREATMQMLDKSSIGRIMRGMSALAMLMFSITLPVGALAASPAADPVAAHTGSCKLADDAAVAALFERWNVALASLDASRVAALYWDDAVLLPTVSNLPRTDKAAITDYFEHFLQRFPRGTVVRRITHHTCGLSVDAGLYDFSVMDRHGKPSTVSARYTFVYTFRDGEWRIQHHHSSAMPETAAPEATKPVLAESGSSMAKDAADTEDRPVKAAESRAIDIDNSTEKAKTTSPQRRPRIQLGSATRMPWSFLSADQRRLVGRETVGIKVCAMSADGERSFTVSDAAPHAEANDAALAWAKSAKWTVSDAPAPAGGAICAQIVVRFTDAGL